MTGKILLGETPVANLFTHKHVGENVLVLRGSACNSHQISQSLELKKS